MAQSLNDKKEFISQVIELLDSDTKLNPSKHANIFNQLEQAISFRNKFDISTLNQNQSRKDLQNTLQAMLEATVYSANTKQLEFKRYDGTKISFRINNNLIYKNLQKPLIAKQFKKLFKLCRNHGVFELVFEHHIPAVTLQAGSRHMTRKWPRDHAGMLPIITDLYPNELWPGLQSWAKAYCHPQEIAAFEKVILKPDSYNSNQGISHIFWLSDKGELTRDQNWQMRQRLESHAELLNAFVTSMLQLFQSPKKTFDQITPEIIKAVVYLTHYLYALGPTPPSCGPWEEIAFPQGINWDCAAQAQALNNIISLIAQLEFHSKIHTIFLQAEKKLQKKLGVCSLFAKSETLKNLCHNTCQIIHQNHLSEFRHCCNRVDASSAMLAASDTKLSPNNDLNEEIEKRLAILRQVIQHLVGEYGARRYSPFQINLGQHQVKSCDSYLNLDSDIMIDANGAIDLDKRQRIMELENNSADASEVEIFIERNLNCHENSSAQWGLPLSYIALAYSRMMQKLIEKYHETGELNSAELKQLKECHLGAEEFIKRSYGNITGIKIDGSLPVKANGQKADIWRKPEAYQAISTLRGNGDYAFLPGVNSHLGWDAATCYAASTAFLNCLEFLEKSELLK